MPQFQICTRNPSQTALLEVPAAGLYEIGERLNRDRFLVGRLWSVDGVELGEPTEVLIPAHVVTLVATHEE